MTLSKFIKQLQRLENKIGGRIPVCADVSALRRTCNDAWNVIDISEASIESIEQVDGDGFLKWRKDGRASERRCLVIR